MRVNPATRMCLDLTTRMHQGQYCQESAPSRMVLAPEPQKMMGEVGVPARP